MYPDYPLLNLVMLLFWMLSISGVFAAIAWCDPCNYERKIGLDVFSGAMFVVATRIFSQIKDVFYTSVTPVADGKLIDLTAITEFAMGFYEHMNFNAALDKLDNQLMALIVIGIEIMLYTITCIISVVFAIYFVFRVFLLIDRFIPNIARYAIMLIALIVSLVKGNSFNGGSITILFLLFNIVSIAKLAIGNVLLYYYGSNTPSSGIVKGDILSVLLGKPSLSSASKRVPARVHAGDGAPEQYARPQQRRRPAPEAEEDRPQQVRRPRPSVPQATPERRQERPISSRPPRVQNYSEQMRSFEMNKPQADRTSRPMPKMPFDIDSDSDE